MPDPLFPGPRRRPALRRRGARSGPGRFDVALSGLVGVFAVGGAYGIASAGAAKSPLPDAGRLTANPLSAAAPPEAAYLLDALVRRVSDLEDLTGESGSLRVWVGEPGEAPPMPDSIPEGVELRVESEGSGVADSANPTPGSGIARLVVGARKLAREVPDFRIVTLLPLSLRKEGRIGKYLLGEWPFERGGKPPSEAYETPAGVVEVTPDNTNLPVSEHFLLGDLLTKGQDDVWPKYVVLSTRLLDKAELTLQEIERLGHPVEHAGVISAFRTPWYNAHGGDTQGRGGLSRHMYGDAMDFYLDSDRDGRMDDLTGDGRVDVKDAQFLANAADAVERAHPSMVGGIGVYSPTGAHAGFVHVDTRGYRARW